MQTAWFMTGRSLSFWDTNGRSLPRRVIRQDVPEEDVIFAGDTLFQDSYGRTDLPTGSSRELVDSVIHKLFVLPEDTMVYPGHGEPTTIGYEAGNNPIACYR